MYIVLYAAAAAADAEIKWTTMKVLLFIIQIEQKRRQILINFNQLFIIIHLFVYAVCSVPNI